MTNGSRRRKRQSSAVSSSPATRPDATVGMNPPTPPDGGGRGQLTKQPDGARRGPAPKPSDGGRHPPARRPKHDVPPHGHDAWPPALQFLSEFLRDWKSLIGFAFVIWTVAFALLLVSAGPALLIYYIAPLHVPVAAKIGITSGSVAITFGGAGAVLSAIRAAGRGRRRDR